MRATLAFVLLLAATACGRIQPPLVSNVGLSSPAPSPGQRDTHNRADVHYHLSAPATLTAALETQNGDGTRWVLHDNVSRPVAGDYVLQFDGTVAGPGPNERRALPDGDYVVVLEAHAADGQQQSVARVTLRVRDADTQPPDVTDMAVLPDRISPNFDAQDDTTHLRYHLAKAATVAAFLDQTNAAGQTERVWMGEDDHLDAGDQNLTWDGLANGQPVASGAYTLGVRATDTAGNVVERGVPVTVEDAGVPVASLASVRIGPRQIIRGDQVCLDAVVRNTGSTVLRTEGPDPSYVYNSLDTYSSIADHQFGEHAGYWRVGLSWSGSTDTNGATYPYRWGFGHDLQPGEEASIHGCVQVLNDQDKLVYFAGLVQENIAIHSAGAGIVRVDISS